MILSKPEGKRKWKVVAVHMYRAGNNKKSAKSGKTG
jgi:hypothetical protein